MRLEIIIDDDPPLFFPFTNKVTIGSDPACEIVIEHPEVSRRHASAFPEDERFFIVDQGSKNGTYLNDERLIPGKKTEFTSFFPVRLGKSILISLISDEEISERTSPGIEIPIPSTPKAPSSRNQDATTLVSLKDLQAAKTETMAKKRAAVRKASQDKKEAPGKKKPLPKKKKISSSQILALLIVVAAGAYQYSLREDQPDANPVSTGPLKKNAPDKAPEVVEVQITPTDADTLLKGLSEKGCETEAEKALCGRIPHLRHLKITENGVDIIVDAGPTLETATEYLKAYTDKVGAQEYNPESREIAQTMGAVFFSKNLVSFPAKDYPSKVITLAFVFRKGEIETFLAIIAYNIDSLPSLNVVLSPQHIHEIRTGGPLGTDFTNKFFRVWNRDKIIWEGPSGVAAPIDQTEALTPTETTPVPKSEYKPATEIRPATQAIQDPTAEPPPAPVTKPVPENKGNLPAMPGMPSPNSP